jgi:hypothetical protein
MSDVDLYIINKNIIKDKKWILMELNKGARAFDDSAITYLTELSQSGEYMQRAKLSLKMIDIEKTPEHIKERAVKKQAEIMDEIGQKELNNAKQIRNEAKQKLNAAKTRGGSLRKKRKTKKTL